MPGDMLATSCPSRNIWNLPKQSTQVQKITILGCTTSEVSAPKFSCLCAIRKREMDTPFAALWMRRHSDHVPVAVLQGSRIPPQMPPSLKFILLSRFCWLLYASYIHFTSEHICAEGPSSRFESHLSGHNSEAIKHWGMQSWDKHKKYDHWQHHYSLSCCHVRGCCLRDGVVRVQECAAVGGSRITPVSHKRPNYPVCRIKSFRQQDLDL